MNTGPEHNQHPQSSSVPHSRSNIAHSIALIFIACIFFVAAVGCSKHHTAHAPSPPKPARIGKTQKGLASWYGIPYHGRRAASGEVFDMEQLTAAHRTLPFQTWLMVTNLDNGKKVEVRITDRGPFVDNRVIDLSKAAAREIDMLGSGTARVKLKVIKPPKNVVAKVNAVRSEITAPAIATPGVAAPLSDPIPPPDAASSPARQGEIPSQAFPQTIAPDVPSPGIAQTSSPILPSGTTYSVQVGAFSSQKNAEALRDRVQQSLRDQAIVRTEPRTGPSGKPLWFVLAGAHLSREAASALLITVKAVSGDGVVVVER